MFTPARRNSRPFAPARIALVAFVLAAGASSALAQNLLRNPGFEDVTGPEVGQGILPLEWYQAQLLVDGADTYSNDGSYGLFPDAFGNFPEVMAYEGLRFVAGWDFEVDHEDIGQVLTAPLTPGVTYRFSCVLQQSAREGQNTPGGYMIVLQSSTLPEQIIAQTGFTTTPEAGWEPQSVEFTAPADADQYEFFVLRPFHEVECCPYPGLDAVELVEVIPPPACYADCDGDTALTIDDFICFQTVFAIGDPYADCDEDSVLTIDDFICFQTFFAIGC